MSNFTEDLAAVAGEFGVTPENRKPRASKRPYFKWTDEMTEKLVNLIDEQKTAEEIAVALCIPLEKVQSKLQALKAKVPSVKPTKADSKPENAQETHEETHAEPENAPETHAEPPIALDRVIFTAFNEFVGLVDDFNRVAGCWRKALRLIEKQLDGCVTMIAQHPETEAHLCKVAAIVAFDELKA